MYASLRDGFIGVPFTFLQMQNSGLGPLKQQSTGSWINQSSCRTCTTHHTRLGFGKCVHRPICSHLQRILTHQTLCNISLQRPIQAVVGNSKSACNCCMMLHGSMEVNGLDHDVTTHTVSSPFTLKSANGSEQLVTTFWQVDMDATDP